MTDEMIATAKKIDAEVEKIAVLKGRLDYLKDRSNAMIKNLSYYTQMARVLTSELESTQHLIDDIMLSLSESEDELEHRIISREIRKKIRMEDEGIENIEIKKGTQSRDRLGYDPILAVE